MNQPIVLSKPLLIRLGWVFVMLAAATIHESSLKQMQASMSAKTAATKTQREAKVKASDSIKATETDSDIALERVKSGCEAVQLTRNNKDARMQPSDRVFDSQTFPNDSRVPRFDRKGLPINGVQPMPEGVLVCNQFGDTGSVGFDGIVTDIKRVQPSRKPEFLTHFNKLKDKS